MGPFQCGSRTSAVVLPPNQLRILMLSRAKRQELFQEISFAQLRQGGQGFTKL
jgi:hypothetical protein